MSINRENEQRCLRKSEHIEGFLKSSIGKDNYFKDVFLENNSLPEISFNEIDTAVDFLGKKISFPLMINAITGGYEGAVRINEELARLAGRFNIPMAVGSQRIALKEASLEHSFKIVRKVLEKGVVISNLGASSSLEEVKQAVDMIEADAVQLHLNAAQEICMEEGERDFCGILDNVKKIVRNINVPVIVKEVGFGISRNTAERLYDSGVRYIDLGGRGGTNFIEIENERNSRMDFTEIMDWGIPTALSLLECVGMEKDLQLVCSGGITRADEIVKALCIGADITAFSGGILRELLIGGYSSAETILGQLIYRTKALMLLLGKKTVGELKTVPYRLKGELKQLLDDRKNNY